MDKGYDYPEVQELLEDYGYTIHIRLRGEHRVDCKRIPRYIARHWIVERTHSWMNRFRRLLIRWEKKVERYVAMLHIAGTSVTYIAAGHIRIYSYSVLICSLIVLRVIYCSISYQKV